MWFFILALVAFGVQSGTPGLVKDIWSFGWRPKSRSEAIREVEGFHLKARPVVGGRIRRPEGEFGAVRKGGNSYHKGIDFLAPAGTPVRAAYSGFICYNGMNGGPDRGYGYTVIIDHGNNFYTLYAHLQGKSSLSQGEWVEAGEQIARVGRSGNARRLPKEFQYQLHFETIHAPSGLMDLGGLRITALFNPRRITKLREVGEAAYGIYWGGVLNPEEFGNP